MAFADHFIGVPQSRWAGYAILAAVIAVAVAILLGKADISLGQRLVVIFVMFILSLPTIGLVLFQLTCLVNGTSKAPFCGWYAWIISIFTIFYCVLLIIVAITMKSSHAEAAKAESFAVSYEEANKMAKKLMGGSSEDFEDMEEEDKEGFEAMKKKEAFEAMKKKEAFEDMKKKKEAAAPAADSNASDKKKEKFLAMEEVEEVAETFADFTSSAAGLMNSANMYML